MKTMKNQCINNICHSIEKKSNFTTIHKIANATLSIYKDFITLPKK